MEEGKPFDIVEICSSCSNAGVCYFLGGFSLEEGQLFWQRKQVRAPDEVQEWRLRSARDCVSVESIRVKGAKGEGM